MPIRAVLFDIDNTLLDFWYMKRKAADAAITAMLAHGLPLPHGEAKRRFWDRWNEVGIERQDFIQLFLTETIGRVDYPLLAVGVHAYRVEKATHLKPYPHIPTVLRELRKRGLKLGAVSDAPRPQAWLRLAALDFTQTFDVVVTHDDTGTFKPDPRPFQRALDALGLQPAEAVFVGDNVRRDVAGAKDLGLHAVWAKYGHTYGKDETTDGPALEDPRDLLKLVDRLLERG